MSPALSTKSPTIRRILREAAEISNAPSADYTAEPLESDLFEWHFTLRGPPNSPYSQGLYHGRIVLPPTYPLRPPAFRFTTPNGRFEANREICLSISGHHEETWQPAWGIRTAIVALRSFMETDARGQLGGLETTEAVRNRLAKESATFRCQVCGKTNADIIASCEARVKELAASGESLPSGSSDVKVPKELNMGWRDEMKTKAASRSEETPKPSETEVEEAAIAEGFVQTNPPMQDASPIPTPTRAGPSPPPTSTSSVPRVRVPQTHDTQPGLNQPNAVPLPPHVPHDQGSQLQQAFRGRIYGAQDDGVPLWLDRLIVAMALVLTALVIRIFIYA
jgi:ubiquitin-conjugating enzyme E2 J1